MEDVLHNLLLALGGVLMTALTYGLKRLTDWIATKIESEYWSGVVTRADDVAVRAVRGVYQAYVKPLKGTNGGKLTDAQKSEAKQKAVAEMKRYLGSKGISELAGLFGAGGGLESFLADTVENAVTNSKNVGKAARTNPQSP